MINKIFKQFLDKNLIIDNSDDNEIGDVYCFQNDIAEVIVNDIQSKMDNIVHAEIYDRYGEVTDVILLDKYLETTFRLKSIWDKMDIYCMSKYNKLLSTFVNREILKFTTEGFCDYMGYGISSTYYDAYGTAVYKIDDDNEIGIFSTEDNGSTNTENVVVTLCTYDDNKRELKVVDIQQNLETLEYYLSDIHSCDIPGNMNLLEVCASKRPFNWNVEDKEIRLCIKPPFREHCEDFNTPFSTYDNHSGIIILELLSNRRLKKLNQLV